MARSDFIKPFSGLADGWEDVQGQEGLGPLALLSQPIYVPRPDQPRFSGPKYQIPAIKSDKKDPRFGFKPMPVAPFEEVVEDGVLAARTTDEWSERAFLQLIARRDCFAIGGTGLISSFGILPSWLRDDDCRKKVLKTIDERGWEPLLRTLKGKENEKAKEPLSLVGVKEISQYFLALSPPERREKEGGLSKKDAKKRAGLTPPLLHSMRSLRLRKAIEIILSLEMALEARFLMNPPRSRDRFRQVSGFPEEMARASYVWDHLWIEPIIYVVSPRPKPVDVERIVSNEMLHGTFEAQTGQNSAILYRILYGAPCSWKVCVAAAQVCNRFYGTLRDDPQKPMRTVAATVRPKEYDERRKILTTYNSNALGLFMPDEHLDAYEDLLLPGTSAPSPEPEEGVQEDASRTG